MDGLRRNKKLLQIQKLVQSWLYIHIPALLHITKGNFSKMTQRGADCGGSTTSIFRDEVPSGRGQEPPQWLWRRGSLCWEWIPTLLAPKHACASRVRNLCPQVRSCLRQGQGAVGWEQCPAKAPIPQPEAGWEGGASKWERQENFRG